MTDPDPPFPSTGMTLWVSEPSERIDHAEHRLALTAGVAGTRAVAPLRLASH